jgi:hypothetical protein
MTDATQPTTTRASATPAPQRVVSRRLLAALTTLVLLAHAALLQDETLKLSEPGRRVAPPSFTTRALPPAAPVLAPVPVKRVSAGARKQAAAAAAPLAAAVVSLAESPGIAPATTALPAPAPAAEAEVLATPTRPPREQQGQAHAYRFAEPVRLQYEVTGSKWPYQLGAELLWQHDGASYNARLAFKAGFLTVMSQTSQGQITDQGLEPLRFADKKRSELAAHFVREQGKISFSANKPDAPLLSGAQDRLSILLQLGAMLAADPTAFAQASTIAVQIVGPRDAAVWLFTVGAEETLALPGGEQIGLKLLRNPREPFDQKIELWLAPDMGYLPVRLRITDANGDFVDQKWHSSETVP